jgi:hypothetical protein
MISRRNMMLINDLSHLEVASEDNNVQGGSGHGRYPYYYFGSQNFADADASANASGGYINATFTRTSASTNSGYYPSASSYSTSSAVSIR